MWISFKRSLEVFFLKLFISQYSQKNSCEELFSRRGSRSTVGNITIKRILWQMLFSCEFFENIQSSCQLFCKRLLLKFWNSSQDPWFFWGAIFSSFLRSIYISASRSLFFFRLHGIVKSKIFKFMFYKIIPWI